MINPKKISWSACHPFVLSLSKHERMTRHHPFGEHSKPRSSFDKLRANGIWNAQLIFLG
ncbi:hypothetical protein Mettu_0653 [Methylobacter tundripaludum SV96]|uniref:Uncharacterized protein n=1 Tax=Methylobacter tundripaludum (strain ATCC BAA-1195 / DSM 17260 / SV96) TaxID=697282 RepID=G3IW50_METTV|nr:hypothetical protein Mettu_0653 [Methylobacter tundripaludum SV96]